MNAITPKRRGRPPKVRVEAYADLGPSIRREAAPGASAASVVVEYRPDPEKPQGAPVRGARAVIIYEWLHAQGQLSDPQREAADRYLVQLERASGAVEGRPDASGVRSSGFLGPTDRQVAALADLRGVDDVLGPDVPMVREVIGWNREPEGGLDVARFRTAMQRAARWWNME